MTLLLLGPNGQVGQALREVLAGQELVALDRAGQGGLRGDLEDPDALVEAVRTLRPRVIVNAAAYTDVDGAERERERAFAVNARAPAVLAEAARAVGARLIHYSTDYVFDGTGERPWREDDPTGPINAYGESKLAGEQAVRETLDDHLILRVSWVYHERGKNFVRTVLRLAQERDHLRIVADQIGAPTPARLIARVTARLIDRPEARGTYHLAPQGETSWHGIAHVVAETARRQGAKLRLDPEAIEAIPSEDYPTPAARPRNSRLDTRRLQALLGEPLPPWRPAVEDTVIRLLAEEKRAKETTQA